MGKPGNEATGSALEIEHGKQCVGKERNSKCPQDLLDSGCDSVCVCVCTVDACMHACVCACVRV